MGFLCFRPFSSFFIVVWFGLVVFNLFGFVCFAMEQVAGACVTVRSQWRTKEEQSSKPTLCRYEPVALERWRYLDPLA
jgi:hypothetical protein